MTIALNPGSHCFMEQDVHQPYPCVDSVLDLDCDCAILPDIAGLESLTLPFLYALELTPICHHCCPGCSNVFIANKKLRDNAPDALSASQWEHVLSMIAPYARRLKITGGEPTCHPEFPAIIGAIQQRAIPFTLFTNGNWHNSQHVVALLKESPSCLGLLVSLHGADAQTHERFTGVAGSFAKTIANICYAAEAGLTIHTSTVINQFNYTHIETIVEFSQSLGARRAVFNTYIGQSVDELDVTPFELEYAIQTIHHLQAIGENMAFGTPMYGCDGDIPSSGCLSGRGYCTIDPWGYVRPCNHASRIAGNILHEPLPTIWHSQEMERWRALRDATSPISSQAILSQQLPHQ